jgi:hypothetical protein
MVGHKNDSHPRIWDKTWTGMEYAGAVMLNNSPAAQQFPKDDAD